jgi:pantothenate synthetase
LHRSLQEVEKAFREGERSTSALAQSGRAVLAQEPEVRLDYFEVVDPETLDPVEAVAGKTLVAVAAYVGTTRLIDNVVLEP